MAIRIPACLNKMPFGVLHGMLARGEDYSADVAAVREAKRSMHAVPRKKMLKGRDPARKAALGLTVVCGGAARRGWGLVARAAAGEQGPFLAILPPFGLGWLAVQHGS